MSADIPEVPDEFATSADLDALLNADPPARKPAKKAAPRSTPTQDQVRAGLTEGEYVVSASGMTPPPATLGGDPDGPTMDDFRALMAEVKSLREQVARPTNHAFVTGTEPVMNNPLPGPVQKADPYNEPVGPRRRDLASEPEAPRAESDGVLVHFVDDGFTVGSQVFYRGQQYVASTDADWPRLSGTEQVLRWGKRFFRLGPWDGDGYDLSDPKLSPSDRVRLLEEMRRQQELTNQFA